MKWEWFSYKQRKIEGEKVEKKKENKVDEHSFIEKCLSKMLIYNAFLFIRVRKDIFALKWICTHAHKYERARARARLFPLKLLNAINSFWCVNKTEWNHHRNGQKTHTNFIWTIVFFPLRFWRIWIEDNCCCCCCLWWCARVSFSCNMLYNSNKL